MIPESPFESPLGPYKLSWVQDNGTQVREDRSLHFLGVPESPPPPQDSMAFGFRMALLGRPGGSWWAGPPTAPGSPLLPPSPVNCTSYWIMSPVRIASIGYFVCKAGSTFLHKLGEHTDKAFLSAASFPPIPHLCIPGTELLLCSGVRPLQPGAWSGNVITLSRLCSCNL